MNSAVAMQSPAVGQMLERAVAEFESRNPGSMQRFSLACEAMPGGNTRSALHYEPFPLTMAAGSGASLTDVDGHHYKDFIGDYTASLFGHSHPLLQQAMHDAIDNGLTLGAPNQYDAQLAALISGRFSSVERLRFTNSGTEANLMALTAARAFTGRTHTLVFRGGYHGGVLSFGASSLPHNAPYPVLIGDYNDAEGAARLIDSNAGSLAAVLVEPMMGTGGAIAGSDEFLHSLRAATERQGAVLIFDEVMTSRLSAGGLQQMLGLRPDMTTFGKYLGGGGTFGAFGGSAEIMDRFDPRRDDAIAHAGTFNNNVLSMAAGLTGLRDIYTPELADQHTARGNRFRDELNAVAANSDVAVQVTGLGSILHLHWQRSPIRSPADLEPADSALRTLFHLMMLERGYLFSQKGFLTLSLPLEESDYHGFSQAFGDVLSSLPPAGA